MNILETHRSVIADYAGYIRSFIKISDPVIQQKVDEELEKGKLWPEPLLQFNPAFESAGKVADLARDGTIHRDVADVFSGYSLYRHQLEAIRLGSQGKDFVVTSGTGSGKSLTYIGTIFSHLLANTNLKGVVAVVVYPLNALINSQTEEFEKYRKTYQQTTGKAFPITFGQYTGQEDESKRLEMRQNPPQILLTNYMMLELLLTRIQERPIRDAIYSNLRYLVFDELHTYRGRQGADVALLIRRIRAQCQKSVSCIGTSATMVSGGSPQEKREKVAAVATSLFGKPFDASQVVQETLTRCLNLGAPNRKDLAEAISAKLDPSRGVELLRSNPLAIWLENEVALQAQNGELERRRPQSIASISESLSIASGIEEATCRGSIEQLLLWISQVNEALKKAGERYTILPFRLHQFISQTGSVYTTLDQGASRFITLEPGIYKKDDSNKKPIFPNVFSRASGHPFICVSRQKGRLLPREFNANSEEDDNKEDGYVFVGTDVWDPETDIDALPDSWFRRNKSGRTPLPERVRRFPEAIWFDEYGNYTSVPDSNFPISGWFMRAPLLFDPTSGTFFEAQTRENTKLAKLGSEGRSTSTTITTFSILTRLREANYPLADQKLLSFTDNRQDAALQSGHFNDFVRVVQLRAAIFKALKDAPQNTLSYSQLGEAIFKALALPFSDYSTMEVATPLPHVRRKYETTLQRYLVYRALMDLKRSWRIVLPNLEQCALLAIDFLELDETVQADDFWMDLEILRDLSHSKRREFLSNILDFFRMEYALHSVNYLEPASMKEAEKDFREQLRPPWTLDSEERLPFTTVIRLDRLSSNANLGSASMGPASSLGKYIKHFVKSEELDERVVQGDQYRIFIEALARKLAEADFLQSIQAQGEDRTPTTVYRLKVERILWKLGDGKTVKNDVVKLRSFRALAPKPNEFFARMYATDFSQSKQLRAEDHTGQLGFDLRREREDRFRADWFIDEARKHPDEARIRSKSISALFCSPTMELGIDIGGLSVVHMRNAPPNPANYAQRSGRAGRSGQGALVFTYCSSFSAHDRHYFQEQADLVAGAVQPPRLDLCNKELLQSHLNALAISEVGLNGLESGNGQPASLTRLVDVADSAKPLSPNTRSELQLSPPTRERIRSAFTRAIQDFLPTLRENGASWYADTWADRQIESIADQLDKCLTRWRELDKAARVLLSRSTQVIESGTLAASSEEYKRHSRTQHQATRQINLLTNDTGRFSSELSEFYPYRYLASEGFLPGYNFTRLPLRIFIPTGQGLGEYISRPRAVALREFGPLNVIYHNGLKYRVEQLVIQDAEQALHDGKVSTKAGYLLLGDQKDREICPFTGVDLSDNANRQALCNLIEMTESRAEQIDRISCEEEERISKGYDIDTLFSVDGSLERVRRAAVKVGDSTMLNIRYIPAARLVYLNRKWRSQSLEGFPLGLTTGHWRNAVPPVEEQKEPHKLVTPWTSNLADALYIEPIQPLGLNGSGVITLQHALKRAIELEFQVEPSEIGVTAVGGMEVPNILIYEAAEGSLGILSRFTEEPDVLHRVIRRAKALCRFDDETYKAPASYDDLLSYFNQRDHGVMDRFLIQDALEKLLVSTVELQSNAAFPDYEAHYQEMLATLDPNSSTERKFIEYLYKKGLRLPDEAQKRVDGIYVQPDFYYEPRVWVFVDGTPHDDPETQREDQRKRTAILERGDEVVVYRYTDDLESLVAERPDIFYKVK